MSKAKKIVHIIPVFASTEEGDEPGWLILTKKKASPLIESMRIQRPFLRWDSPVKSWFVHEDRIGDALDAIEFTTNSTVSYCADCKDGLPCDTWKSIPRVDYVVRKPGNLDPPNRAQLEYAEDLFEWHEIKAKAPPPPPPPRHDPWDGFRYNPPEGSRYGQGPGADAQRGPGTGPRRGHTPPESRGNPYRYQPIDPFAFMDQFLKEFIGRIFVADVRQPPPPPKNTEMPPQEAAKILGLPWPCQKEELAPAFKKAVLVAHPDRGGSTEKMAKINVARDVLSRHLGA